MIHYINHDEVISDPKYVTDAPLRQHEKHPQDEMKSLNKATKHKTDSGYSLLQVREKVRGGDR